MIRDIHSLDSKESILIHSDLSYKIIGAAFSVFNELGFGHLEKIYQRAFAKELQLHKLNFKDQK